MMRIVAIVDSLPAAERAMAAGWAALLTDNPLLAHHLRERASLDCTDAYLSQPETHRLGAASLAITHDVDRALGDPALARSLGLPQSHLYLSGVYSRTVSSLLHRAVGLSRALERHAPTRVHLLLTDQPDFAPTQPLMAPRFQHPARALARRGFFGLLETIDEPVPAPLPASINDTAADSLSRRISLLPASAVAYELMQRVRTAASGATDIVVGEVNEAIRETLPFLVRRGLSLRHRGALARAVTAEPDWDLHGQVIDIIRARARPALEQGISRAAGLAPQEQAAIVQLLLEHLERGLVHLSAQTRQIEARLKTWFPDGGGVLVSNGLFGPAGVQAYALCRQRNISVVEFEHGVTAGISALTDTKLAEGTVPSGDRVLVCSRGAKAAFEQSAPGSLGVDVIGLPDHTRRLLNAPMQRRLARRLFGLKRGDVCVMHVSTLPYYGNHRPGLATPSESTTFSIDRQLIEDVYGAVPHQVVFKQYPTQRFPFEPSYDRLFRLAGNVRITKDEDFRYMRAAADVIVTLTPTSTFGWCVGTNRPLVWLDSRHMNPLSSDELRDRFRQAFLFVDLDVQDWPARLRSLLSRPLQALTTDWAARSAARRELLEELVTGPPGRVGARAAAIVAAEVERRRRTRAPASAVKATV